MAMDVFIGAAPIRFILTQAGKLVRRKVRPAFALRNFGLPIFASRLSVTMTVSSVLRCVRIAPYSFVLAIAKGVLKTWFLAPRYEVSVRLL
jgi:hypothetical protein